MPQLSPTTAQMLSGTGSDIKDMQRNALGKRYNVKLQLVITEANGNNNFFDSGLMTWHDCPYQFAVLMEKALVELLEKLTTAGIEIATGGEAEPPTS